MMELIRRAIVSLALAGVSCSGNPRPKPPEPPPPSPQCAEGQACGCWHHPPEAMGWLYACCAPGVPGGVVSVQDPAQCIQPPTPGPEPTPTPPSPGGPLPAKGTPQGPERLLRSDGGRLRSNDKPFEMVMAVPCCMGWAKVPNQRWPMASEAFMDETMKSGVNAFHFRLGPWFGDVDHESEWADIGGAYKPGSLEWNVPFWEKVRTLGWHAYEKQSFVEVVAIDSWYCKRAKPPFSDQQLPWPKADVDACGVSPSPEQERLIRKSVEELGCFGNVIWATGNEEDELSGMNAQWLNWVIGVIRDEEQKSGCSFVHMIGTGSHLGGVQADYQITHSKSPLTGPTGDRWTLNNEHNPEFPPDQEASYFVQARSAHQSWAAWRAGAGDPAWEERLALYKNVIGGSAVPVGCYAPDSEDPAWGATLTPAQRPAQMMAALNAAKVAVGNRCGATAECDHEPTAGNPCAPPVHLGCLETNGLVAAELRKQGYCATGPWTDATAILAPDGYYEEMHVCSTGDGCYTGNPYKLAWKYNGQGPSQPPIADGCSDPEPPPLYSFSGPVLHGNWWDGTPVVNDHAYCVSVGMGTMPDGVQPRNQCPPRSECPGLKCEERAACERQIMGGLATWRSDGPVEVNQSNENHLQARCSACSWIEVCDAAGRICKRSAVQ